MATLKDQLTNAMKSAMRAKDKERLGIVRLMLAECQRAEVDERIELSDQRVLAILDRMVKQRRDSAKQYQDAGRDELAAQENFEISIIQEFLPAALSETELVAIIDEAIRDSGASSPQDMGKVMAAVKPKIQGRADMGAASQLVKQKLTG